MATFVYKARNTSGAIVKGTFEAKNEDAVVNSLSRSGMIPISVMPEKKPITAGEYVKKTFGIGRPKLIDIVMFCKQMYTLTRSGVPILRAMKVMYEGTRNPDLKLSIHHLADSLEGGHSLAESMQDNPGIYTPLMVSMVNVGENTGHLEAAFSQLAIYIENEDETRKKVKAAIRYPIMVISVLAVAIAIINIMVIPAFAGFFEGFDAELPWQTVVLVTASDLTVEYWPYMLGLLILIFIAIKVYVNTEKGEELWDRYKLKLPLIGRIYKHALLGRFTKTFAMTLNAGVPVLQALTVCARAADNVFVGQKIMEMRAAIERGTTFSVAAANSKMFTPLVVQMIMIGEETGNVDGLLNEVADHYDREVDYDVKKLSSNIEPILISVLAGVVLILALGVFLPMWNLASVALGK